MKKNIKSLENRVKELEDQLARVVADYRNLEKRLEDEKKEFIKFANRELLLKLIPSFDTLFLAEKHIADEGIKITIKHLQDALRDVGVERVKTVGEMYDPEKMEALATAAGEENKVLEELRPGYVLNGKLVRPAQVKVGQASS
jgi:molecular chaperone GrpE